MSKFMSRIQHDSRLHQCGWKLGWWMGWIASSWWAGISYRGALGAVIGGIIGGVGGAFGGSALSEFAVDKMYGIR